MPEFSSAVANENYKFFSNASTAFASKIEVQWNIVGDVTLNYGKFLTAVMNFLIMAFVVFILVKALNTAARIAPLS